MAECNALGRGPVVFEMAQAGIAAIRRKAAGKFFFPPPAAQPVNYGPSGFLSLSCRALLCVTC